MAFSAYLKIFGTTQGEVRGSVTQRGREGTIRVNGVFHTIVAPRDPVTGRPTGKRMHKPFIISKDLDQATPLLQSMLTRNENIARWELQLYRSAEAGVERPVYKVELTNATIASIQFHVLNVKSPTPSRAPEHEEIAFAYQKILWTWADGGISAADDWLTPR